MPLRSWKLKLNSAWPDRYAVSELETTSGKRVFLAVSHLAKPWLSGISEPEYAKLASQYDWLAGPVVAVGDFNAAPWALPMRHLLKQSGMKALRWPLATWPVAAGRFGIPIDQVLVHEGARVVRIAPFGDRQNSNHRGFVVDIALP
jgi:endonuclease/exonuclease/phosphatase (EEP) superfamily protein YafD